MTGRSKKVFSQHAIEFGLFLTCLDKIHFKKYSSLSEIDWSWSWWTPNPRPQEAGTRWHRGSGRGNENKWKFDGNSICFLGKSPLFTMQISHYSCGQNDAIVWGSPIILPICFAKKVWTKWWEHDGTSLPRPSSCQQTIGQHALLMGIIHRQ